MPSGKGPFSNLVMSATETIISFAVKKVLDKAIGGPTAVITGYHKVHFVLLYRVIREAERDAKIQKEVRKIQENLASLIAFGQSMLHAIPPKPEPPSAEIGALFEKNRNAAFTKELNAFYAGVKNIVETLREYVGAAREIVNRTEKELDALEKRLDSKNVKHGALRKISNAARQQDIDLIRVVELEDLSNMRGRAEARLEAYLNY